MIVILSEGGVSWLQVASSAIGPARVDDGDHVLSAILLDDAYSGPVSGGLAGIALPRVQAVFAVCLVFCVAGLDWEHWRGYIDGKVVLWGVAALVVLCVQGGFGFAWSAYDDYGMATMQLKLSSVVTPLAVIALIMALPAHLKAKASDSFLGKLGDAFFGIYLCHMFAVAALGKVLALIALPIAVMTALRFRVIRVLRLASHLGRSRRPLWG